MGSSVEGPTVHEDEFHFFFVESVEDVVEGWSLPVDRFDFTGYWVGHVPCGFASGAGITAVASSAVEATFSGWCEEAFAPVNKDFFLSFYCTGLTCGFDTSREEVR